jgi:hypothetical protein
VADRPQAVATAWTCRGARTPTTVPPVRPRGPQAATPTTARLSIHFLLRPSVLAKAEDPRHPRRRALPRGCASSPLHRSPPNLGHSSALGPSSSSTSCLSPSRGGKGALLVCFRLEFTGASPPSWSTMASSPLSLSSFSDLCPTSSTHVDARG